MNKGDQAHKWAQEIYDLSAQCLMAHSIRAVERYIEEKINNPKQRFRHSIKVIESDSLYKHTGKRALVYIHTGWSDIVVDKGLDFEHKRLAIAHELAHILFAKSNGGNNSVARDRETEESCRIFEKDLCKKHHKFYSDPEQVKALRFSSFVGSD